MKVNVVQQIEIDDEQRLQLGAILFGATKPKKVATRDEIKEWAWEHGAAWAVRLRESYERAFAPAEPDADVDGDDSDELDDLLGDVDDGSDLL